jgi:hypothetical protein
MPFRVLKGLQTPPKPTTAVWRHISIAQLVSMLESNALWFSSVTELEDRFEGSYPVANVLRRRVLTQATENFGVPDVVMQDFISKNLREMRSSVYVNCWYAGFHESAALWQWAARRGESVALKSTFRRLSESVSTTDDVFASKVMYVDYQKQLIPEGSTLNVFFCKRRSFRHEREVRLLIDHTGKKMVDPPKGILVAADVARLVTSIVVEPEAPRWIREVVGSLTRRYRLDVPVVQSTLDLDPMW